MANFIVNLDFLVGECWDIKRISQVFRRFKTTDMEVRQVLKRVKKLLYIAGIKSPITEELIRSRLGIC